MKLALAAVLLAPAIVLAEPASTPAPSEPTAEPAAPPPLPEPAYAPDPIALYPAGLVPQTLCRYGVDCRAAAPPAPAATPLSAAASVTGARLSYSGHPSRTGGDELVARVDLWRGLTWSAMFGYTVDSIDSTTTTGSVTTRYHDALVGARIALPFDRPTWLAATGHLMSGTPDATGSAPAAMGNGGAGYLALGQRYDGVDLELALAGMSLDGDWGLTGSLRASAQAAWIDGWLEAAVETASVSRERAGYAYAGAGASLHAGFASLSFETYAGDRALSVLDRGELVESVSDTMHLTGRALVRFDLGPHFHPYLGVAGRSATTAPMTDATTTSYRLVTGFAGATFTF